MERSFASAWRPALLKYNVVSAVKYDRALRAYVMAVPRRHIHRLYLASQLALFAGALTVAVLANSSSDWHPPELVALLLVLSVVGERLTITVGSQSLSAGFIALVLAMTLLG